MKLAMIGLLIVLCGCTTRKPGGRSDRWFAESRAENGVIYNGIGIRF